MATAYEMGRVASIGYIDCSTLDDDDIEKQNCENLRKMMCCDGYNFVMFPAFTKDEASWDFIRGCFEEKGWIADPSTEFPECSIRSRSLHLLSGVAEFTKIPCVITGNVLSFQGTNCIDFLGKIYERPETQKTHLYRSFMRWLTKESSPKLPRCLVHRADPAAVFPRKGKPSDVGYDLTVIKVAKNWHNNITLYDTGINVKVQHGYYAEVVPRSSLSKSGYMLANSIGIIDANYTGNIYIALVKVDPSAPDIELPFRCCQLIFRRQHYMEMIEVDQKFEGTTREDGGFGSTGTK